MGTSRAIVGILRTSRKRRGALAGLLVAALFLTHVFATRPQEAKPLALLPFENASGHVGSLSIVMPVLEAVLTGKGYQLTNREQLELFLQQERIRRTGMLSRQQLNSLNRQFGLDFALVGTVDLFYESEDNPQWGISARMVSTADGTIHWAGAAGLTGGDFTTVLGLGTIKSPTRLAHEVVRILFESLPDSGSAFVRPSPVVPARRISGSGHSYRNQLLDSSDQWRVAVVPFENASERPGAGGIVTDVFTTALFQHGRYRVVDPGEVRQGLIAVGIPPYGDIDFATLSALRQRTGVDAVFVGTIYRYNEGLKRETITSPEISLDVRLIHAETGKILWFASHERSGDDYQIALDFGIVRPMIALVLRTAKEMLETL